MKMKAIAAFVVLVCLTALPAAADSFTISVCNTNLSPSCSSATMPVGTIVVTQNGTNALDFKITMDNYPASHLQWGIGSQGTGDTLAMMLGPAINMDRLAPAGFSLSNITATLFGGAQLNTGWVVDAGYDCKKKGADPCGTHVQRIQHEDGFGDWNLGINNPALGGGNPSSSLIAFNFTLNHDSALSLSDLIYNSPDSNCDSLNPKQLCYFAMHANSINTATGTTNFNTGYAGATKDIPKTPEPASMMLLGAGMLGLMGLRRKRS